jgi:transcription antitermination factor NusG
VKKMGEACQFANTSLPLITPALEVLLGERSIHPWYALKVRGGSELATVQALESRGFRPYCPTQKERRRYSDRMKVVEKPLFPGYVFCSFDVQKKLPVISCPGVDYIVGFSSAPTPIPDAQLQSVRRMVAAGASSCERPAAGDRVRITHGPLTGVEGILVQEAHGTRLVVSIELLNRAASLLVDQDHTTPVRAAR